MQDKSKGATFWGHLTELKQRVKIIFITLIATTIFFMVFPADPWDLLNSHAWVNGFYKPAITIVLNWIKGYVAPKGLQIISLEIGAPLEVYFLASLFFALLVSSPVIAYEIYKFVDPALRSDERRTVYSFVTGFTLLFVIGAMFGLLVLSPFITWTVILFSGIVGSTPIISVMDFYSMVFTFTIFTGLAFTIPAIFVLLAKFRLVKASTMTKYRLYIWAIIYIITAIITPDGGPLADALLFFPVIVIWEIAVVVAKRYEKGVEPLTGLEKVSKTESSDKCKFCGKKLKPPSVFCPKCGKAQL